MEAHLLPTANIEDIILNVLLTAQKFTKQQKVYFFFGYHL